MTPTMRLDVPPTLLVDTGYFIDVWTGAPKSGTQPLYLGVPFAGDPQSLLYDLDDAGTYTLNKRHDITFEMLISPAIFGAPVATMVLSPSSLTLLAGATAATSIVLRDSLSNVLSGRTVTYDTSDHAIATVDSAGAVHGLTAGVVILTAFCETHTTAIVVTVNAIGSVWSVDFSADFGS